MKTRKGRHKLLATHFLSNISLDGKQCLHSEIRNTTSNVHKTLGYTASHSYHQALGNCPPKPADNVQKKSLKQDYVRNKWEFPYSHDCIRLPRSNVEKLKLRTITDLSSVAADVHCSCIEECRNLNTRYENQIDTSYMPDDGCQSLDLLNVKTTSTTGLSFDELHRPYLSYAPHITRSSLKASDHLFVDITSLGYKRIALRAPGLNRSTLAVFSILPYRKSNGSHFKVGRRTLLSTHSSQRNIIGADQLSSHLMQPMTDAALQTCAQNLMPDLSFHRPVGDEVISFVHFLQSQSQIHQPTSNLTQGYNRLLLNYPEFGSNTECHGKQSTKSNEFISTNRPDVSSILQPSDPHSYNPPGWLKLNAVQSVSSLSNSFRSPQQITNKKSHGQLANGSLLIGSNNLPTKASMIHYPDPLTNYIPLLLDDPELLVATNKRVLKLPNYLTSIIGYTRFNEHKREVNREFHERFPFVQLSLTKLRSIKSVIVQIVRRSSFDLWIAAHAHVLLEKLILKLYINKLNRKLCASAALLISAKLNDIKGVQLTNLIQELEQSFRISRRELLSIELNVSFGLEFCLIPSEWEILPHCQRIYKSLDLTPPLLNNNTANNNNNSSHVGIG